MEIPCRGCNTTKEEASVELRYDAYGIPTGHYCDACYENNYPYRKDSYYDESYAGEYLDDEY
jgi:Ni,Fe-hydrogenase I small subunit